MPGRKLLIAAFLLMVVASVTSRLALAERAGPFRIGVLTESWGPPAAVAGLRKVRWCYIYSTNSI